jgi:hypothetical protein
MLTPDEVDQNALVLPPRALHDFRTGGVRDILRDPKAPYELADLEGGLRLAALEKEVVLLLNQDGPVAQAAQWNYKGGGRVRVCGIALLPAWEKTPAPRWLLAEMINTGTKEKP